MGMRVYADFNALAGRGADCALMLECSGTLQDLHRLRIRLADHERLTFWDQSDETEDLEVDALLVFDSASMNWRAEFRSDTIRYVPHIPEPDDFDSFPCYRCRAELGNDVKAHGNHSVCPSCGLAIRYPFSPPEEVETGAP